MVDLTFLKQFEKELSKMDGIGTSSLPPRYWYSTGNYILNKIISGSFFNGVPQGRITNFAGAAGSGKSFLAANIIRSAQEAGAFCLVVDTENALDDEFMSKIGVNVKDNYKYVEVTTIPQVVNVVSSFLQGYKRDFGEDINAPQVVILIDSLNMLMTETELSHYEKGDTRGDQGQKNKQLKSMLTSFVQDIKKLNVAIVVTSQVYRNQDILNGEGNWIVSDAVKYSASQIVLLSKLKLKDESGKSGAYAGIRMKCEGYKTRFTLPFQSVTIEVPYATGMDPYSGLLDTAISMGVVTRKGSRYAITGSEKSWYSTELPEYADEILEKCESIAEQSVLKATLDGIEVATEETPSQ